MSLCTTTLKTRFREREIYEEMVCEWSMANANEMVLGLGNFNGHVGKCAEGFEGIHGGCGIGKRNVERRMLLFLRSKRFVCCKYVVQEER